MKSFSLFLALSLLAATSAFAYTEFTPDARTGPSAFGQGGAVVASHGGYLTAWTTFAPYPLGSSVWISTPAATTATPLDPGNILARGVSLSSGRDGYFAAWYSDGQMSAAVIDSFGRVERRTRVPLTNGGEEGATLTAWNGAVHLVVCRCRTLSATLFDDNGDAITPAMEIGSPDAKIALLSDANGFLVVSSHPAGDTDALYGRRISSSGVAGDWFLIRGVASRINGVAATSDGSRDIVAWGDQFGVWVMEVGGAAAQLTPNAAAATDVVSACGRLWIAYQENGSSFYMTVASDGFVTPPAALPVIPARLATNGSTMLAAGLRTIADTDVFGSVLTLSGAGEPFLISRSKTDQTNGFIAGKLLVWDEQIGAHRQVFIGGFDRAGRQLSSDGDNTNPVAAFNGTDYLVVWLRMTEPGKAEVVARRVSASGEIIDGADIDVGETLPGLQADVASDGTGWLVASIREVANEGICFLTGGTRVILNRVTPEGMVLDGAGVVMPSREAIAQRDVSLGWTGTRYLLAWRNECALFHNPMRSFISGAFVARDLAEIDDFVVAPAFNSGLYSAPRVAAGEPSLIAWTIGNSTQFRIINGPVSSRRRSYSPGTPILGRVDGSTLIDAVRNPNGTFSIFTQGDLTWTAGYRGVFETNVLPTGAQATSFRYAFGEGEQIAGNVDVSSGVARVVETMFNGVFDPAAGARRLWAAEVAGPR